MSQPQTTGRKSLPPATARVDAVITALRALLGENYDRRARKLHLESALAGHDAPSRVEALETLVLGAAGGGLDAVERRVAEWTASAEAERRLDALVERELEGEQSRARDSLRLRLMERASCENAATLARYAQLAQSERISLGGREARPLSLDGVVGQRQAVEAMLACLATPFPQHMLLTGPAGMGKTTAARLALEAACAHALSPFATGAPFIEADGATLRTDPHNGADPLIGSVHDPLYQGARDSFARSGIPEPRPGLVSAAHGGVLFIDEIGEMDTSSLNKLLKVLEDKRVRFHSSYYDPCDRSVPQYVRYLFDHGAPADFVLIGATTRSPSELPQALVSRCAVVRFGALGVRELLAVTRSAARRLGIDIAAPAAQAIALGARDGRQAVRMLLSAYGRARGGAVSLADAEAAVAAEEPRPASFPLPDRPGVVNMLGIAGGRGCVAGLEAALYPGGGGASMNRAAGSMARDAAGVAFAAADFVLGGALAGQRARLNCFGGGQVDGPSMGLAAAMAIFSAHTGRRVRQDIAFTGEITLRGEVLPVGGVREKAMAALRAGKRRVLVPEWNAAECAGMPIEAMGAANLAGVIAKGGCFC